MRRDTSPEDGSPKDGSLENGPEGVMLVFGADGHLDEGTAHAFVDGALSDEDATRVVLHLRACVRCAALAADARGLAAAAAGIVRRLDDGVGAVPARAPASARPAVGVRERRIVFPRAGLRVAAAALLAAGVGGSAYIVSRPAREVTRAESAPQVSPAAAAAGAAASAASPAPGGAPAPSAAPNVPALVPRAVAPRAVRPEPRALAAAPLVRRPVEPAAGAADSAAGPRAEGPRATDGIVVGEVRDVNNRPLAAANVGVAGTSINAMTDDSGRFVLRDVPAGTVTLRARRIGYGAGETAVAVGGADTTRAALRLDARALALEQAVVTGSEAAALGGSSFGVRARSERRVRRTPVEADAPSGCYAVVGIVDTAPRMGAERRRSNKTRAVALPPLVHLGADGAVSGAGGVQGTWTRIGADTLRLVWTDPALPALVLGRDSGGWVATGERLTPTRCEEP